MSKSFRASRALVDVSLAVAPGEVHGLVGENGSGKSTLVKVLSGYHAPDRGASLLIDGQPLELPVRPAAMGRFGLSVVHQDLGLIDAFSVVENMRVGLFGVRRFTRAIRWRQERELARASLAALGAQIDPDAPVAGLSAAERAEVAIARALQHHEHGRGLVMFDESTRALPLQPRRHFYSLLRDIARRGGSVLLVTHQLEEVLEHTDRVTVLRDGRVAGGGVDADGITEHDLIRLMLGRELPRRSKRPDRAVRPARPAAEIRGLRGRLVTDANLSVGAGEVVGLTGLLGSGFEELPYLIAGARPASAGTVSVAGAAFDLRSASVRELLKAGIALVPERRDTEGLALSESMIDNVTLPRVRSRGRTMHIGRAWREREAASVIRELAVHPADPHMPVGQLSGGNQQKVLVGKWLCGYSKLLVLHEPTQGVDVGARQVLEAAISAAAQRGAAVLVAGLDAGELARLCDRVLLMCDGHIDRELTAPLSPELIIEAVYRDRRKARAS
ncbi:MAG: sugar ABC transporter ATP-binding protein [Solirubrobacterales bacterium]|nr:sugar ABC transporter ATP-binding protein [Solirubrobacterales bacterium]MBV9534281.1 sugar ABC transporter ATP-binding protein [Solirubrobacterales bacterium]